MEVNVLNVTAGGWEMLLQYCGICRLQHGDMFFQEVIVID